MKAIRASKMTTIKQPKSAAATARLLSRILRENGFEKGDPTRRWKSGFYVHRSGNSNSVHADYFVPDTHKLEKDRNHRNSKVAQMREVLFELGYISSHPTAIYIKCQHP